MMLLKLQISGHKFQALFSYRASVKQCSSITLTSVAYNHYFDGNRLLDILENMSTSRPVVHFQDTNGRGTVGLWKSCDFA